MMTASKREAQHSQGLNVVWHGRKPSTQLGACANRVATSYALEQNQRQQAPVSSISPLFYFLALCLI
jgi:hypothetical protein